jgi:hypothetical protein
MVIGCNFWIGGSLSQPSCACTSLRRPLLFMYQVRIRPLLLTRRRRLWHLWHVLARRQGRLWHRLWHLMHVLSRRQGRMWQLRQMVVTRWWKYIPSSTTPSKHWIDDEEAVDTMSRLC